MSFRIASSKRGRTLQWAFGLALIAGSLLSGLLHAHPPTADPEGGDCQACQLSNTPALMPPDSGAAPSPSFRGVGIASPLSLESAPLIRRYSPRAPPA